MTIVSNNADPRAQFGPLADRHFGDEIAPTITSRMVDDEAIVLGALFHPELAPKWAPRISADRFDDPTRRAIARAALIEIDEHGVVTVQGVGVAVLNDDANRIDRFTLADELTGLLDGAQLGSEDHVEAALRRLIDRKQARELEYETRAVADLLQHGRIGLAEARARLEYLKAHHAEESCRASIESGPARHDIRVIPASQLGAGQDVEWLWWAYVATGFVTLLTGLWKAGKTTLLAHLLKLWGTGGDLVGSVRPAKVLVVAEEGAALWRRRRDDLGFGDHAHFIIRHFKGKPGRREWESFIAGLAELVRAEGFGVVIVDTIGTIWPVENENDAAPMTAALLPLHEITEAGAGVLLMHHPRKGDAGEGQASRGSGALPGFVDIIVELRRFKAEDRSDRRRVLTAYSRFDETPDEMVIELGEGGYRVVGSRRDAKQSDRMAVIVEILPTSEADAETVDQVLVKWEGDVPKPGKRTLQEDLRQGCELGLWERTGQGIAHDPHRYFKPTGGPHVLSRTLPFLDAQHDINSAEGEGP